MPNHHRNARAYDLTKTPRPLLFHPRPPIHIPGLVQDDQSTPRPRSGRFCRSRRILRLGLDDERDCGFECRGSVVVCPVGYAPGRSFDERGEEWGGGGRLAASEEIGDAILECEDQEAGDCGWGKEYHGGMR